MFWERHALSLSGSKPLPDERSCDMAKNKDAEKADRPEDQGQAARGGGDVSGKDVASSSGSKTNDEDGGASADMERSREIHIKD
jgi:hypothetical protein